MSYKDLPTTIDAFKNNVLESLVLFITFMNETISWMQKLTTVTTFDRVINKWS